MSDLNSNMKKSATFGVELQHIPWLSARADLVELLCLFRSAEYRQLLTEHRGQERPHRFRDAAWLGRPETIMTGLVREAIIGLESYIPLSVMNIAILEGRQIAGLIEAVENPFSLRGKGTADSCYNRVPALADPAFALETSNPALWTEVVSFYREVRNPLLHAYELASSDPLGVRAVFEFLWRVYQWVDTWHPPEKMVERMASAMKPRGLRWAPSEPSFLYPPAPQP